MNVTARPITFDNKLSACISLVMSLGLIGGGLWGRQVNAYERENWVTTQGIVLETRTYRQRQGLDETYAPVIEFEANGDRAQYIGPAETFRWAKGKEVTLRYDPQQPNQAARIVKPFDEYAPIAAILMGLFVAGAGLKQVIPFQFGNTSKHSIDNAES